MTTSTSLLYDLGRVAVVLLIGSLAVRQYSGFSPRYPKLPTVRLSSKPSFLGSWQDSQTFVTDCMKILSLGWERFSRQGQNYLVDTPMGKYMVVAPEYLDEIMRAGDAMLGAVPAQNIMTQTKHTFSPEIAADGWHMLKPIRKDLVANTPSLLGPLTEEARLCLDAEIGEARQPVVCNSLELSFNVVVRTANRALFGEELARSKIWQEVSILYSIVMFYGADVIRNYPELLKGSVLRKRTDIERVRQRARDCLVPILKRRLSEQAAHKEKGLEQVWESQKPTDMIQWVLDADPSAEHDFEDIVLRMLHITVAAVHTTTFTFVEVLHCMAVMPEWLDELREEAIGVLREEQGWSKNALAKLRKLDSFCNEAARVCPLSALKLARLALTDWQMKNGLKVPKGTLMFVNHLSMVQDNEHISDADKFYPWRNYDLRQEEQAAGKHQFVMASHTNLTWGYGKHACPGRFFATNEIKMLLTMFLLRYDISATNLPNGLSDVIKGRWYNVTRMPIDHAELKFSDRSSKIPPEVRGYVL